MDTEIRIHQNGKTEHKLSQIGPKSPQGGSVAPWESPNLILRNTDWVSPGILSFFFLSLSFFFFGHASSMWKFLGQGLNPHRGSHPCCRNNNAGSLIARPPGTPPVILSTGRLCFSYSMVWQGFSQMTCRKKLGCYFYVVSVNIVHRPPKQR